MIDSELGSSYWVGLLIFRWHSGISPTTPEAQDFVRRQNDEHYHDLLRSSKILSSFAAQSLLHAHCTMTLIYLLHEHDWDYSLISSSDMLSFASALSCVTQDESDRFWIISSVLNLIWHDDGRQATVTFAVSCSRSEQNKAGFENIPSSKLSILFERLYLSTWSNFFRWLVSAFISVIHPDIVLKCVHSSIPSLEIFSYVIYIHYSSVLGSPRILDMMIAGCPAIASYVCASLVSWTALIPSP